MLRRPFRPDPYPAAVDVRWRYRMSPRCSTFARSSATPVRSSAATAIFMEAKVSSAGWWRKGHWSRSCSPSARSSPRRCRDLAQPAEGARRQGDGARLAGRRAQGRAVPLRRRRARPAATSTTSPATSPASSARSTQPPPPIGAAMKMGNTAPGRTALGAAAAAGVKHMAHRFIVGETPRAALGVLARPVEGRRRLLGRPARRGDRHRRPRPQRYAERCAEALDTLVDVDARAGRRARSSSATRAGRCRARTCRVKVSRAHAAAAARRARARPARRRRAAARRCCAARASSARTCTSTWSRWTRATPCSS